MTAPALLPVRVLVHDAWDQVALEVPPATTVRELKGLALSRIRVAGPPDAYEMKLRGARVLDEGATLAAAGVVPNAQLIVLRRRRAPVR